jgi:hypothetical protein
MTPRPLKLYTVAMPAMCGAMSPCPGTSNSTSVSTCNVARMIVNGCPSDSVCAHKVLHPVAADLPLSRTPA